jgi:valyl-tRNA synthetase
MYGNLGSDINLTMAASQAFEGIINQVVTSNLNFCLEQSPFSAVIHLKKTVIRNKSGTLLIPPPTLSVQLLQVQSDNYRQAQKIINLESIIKSLKSENLKSSNTIKELESELEREKFKVNAIKKEVSEEKEILDQEKEAIQSAQNRIETENKKLDHKVRELESKKFCAAGLMFGLVGFKFSLV